jgi:hypothetical protein
MPRVNRRSRVARVLVMICVLAASRAGVSGARDFARTTSFDSLHEPLVGAGTPLPILTGATWAYFKGTVAPPASWNTIAFNDASWLTGPSGFGYGDGDDATVFSDMQNSYTTVYTRRQFDVPNPAAIGALELRADYDDGFVAYLNGVEVARRNIPAGTPSFNTLASSAHEASGGTNGNAPETISLNAFVGQLVAGTNVLAIQGINVSLSSSDLTMRFELRVTNAPPAAPSNPSPAANASGVVLNPQLCVDVADSNGGNLTATFYGREVTGAAAPDFTIIALPDTQYYSASFPATYIAQTQWLVDNRVPRNIAYIAQLGDCVDTANTQQYTNADAAWDIVEANGYSGHPTGLPYGIAVGNHDQLPNQDPGTLADEGATTGAFNSFFGISRFTGREYYGNHYGINNDNHYDLFSASGMDFIAVYMEFMPSDTPLRQAVLSWANGVLQAFPNRRSIVVSHYLMETGTSTAFGNQGQATYDALKGNPNLFLMLAGHLDQASRRTDVFNGHTVYTLKSDYQSRPNGGDGWLRIMTFSPANGTIQVETYSPSLGQFIYNHADNVAGTPQNQFTLTYDMNGGSPFAVIGTDVEPSGGRACVAWPGRQPGKQYEWYVTVSDGTDTTTGPTNRFTTAATCSQNSDCQDGNACNGAETCVGSTCQAGTPLSCGDGNACTTDTCDAVAGCQHAVVTCNDNSLCTTDSCSPATGCSFQPVSCPQGQVCNGATGACGPIATTCTSAPECNDGDACTTDACDAANVSALAFDGVDDYVTMGPADGETALGARAFTLETWVRRSSASWGTVASTGTGGVSAVPLVTKGRGQSENSNVDANYFLGITTAGRPVADFEQFAAAGGWSAGQNHPACSSTTITDQGWHHVAVTYSVAAGWEFYVDGVEGTTADGTSCTTCSPAGSCPQSPGVEPRYDSIQHFGLGTAMNSTGVTEGFFAGVLDEPRVWNRVLSAAEIVATKNQTITPDSSLIGHWRLNDNGGTSAADETAPAEDGTLTGGPVWSPADKAPLSGSCTHAPIAGCQHCNGTEECLDTNVCNGTAFCSGGVCQPGTPLNCDDNNLCTTDGCDAEDGCQHAPVGCSDGLACTADSCDPVLGCQHVSTCPAGQACDPGSGSCVPSCTTAADCNDASACTTDTCNGQNSYALSLNGTNQSVAMGTAPGLGVSAFTVEAWIKWNGTAGTGIDTGTSGLASAIPLVTKGRGESEGSNVDMNYFLGIDAAARVLAVDFEEGSGTCVGGTNPGAACYLSCSDDATDRCSVSSQCTSPATCTQVIGCTGGGTCNGSPGLNHPLLGTKNLSDADVVNQWNHVAATYDYSGSGTGTLRLYLNGNPQGQLFVGRPLRADSIQHFGIGTALTSTGSTGGFFGGRIDEVRVWNRALSQGEIQANRGVPLTSGTGLLGRWGFDDGATATDSVAPAENGTLVNTPVFDAADKPSLGVGICGHAPVTCDDGNACTTDSCNASTGCSSTYAPTPGCCTTSANCNDGSPFTVDTCTSGNCTNALATTCDTNGDCNDGNVCTTDSCAGPNVSALNFDGTDDYVTMGAAAGETSLGARAFTLETWIRRDGATWGATTNTGTGGVTAVPLVTKGRAQAENSTFDANYFLGITTGGRPVADFEQFAAGGGWVAGQNHPACSSATITDQNWHHVAVTYSVAAGWKFYVDGVEGTTADGTSCTTCSPAGSCPQSPGVEPRYDSIQHFGLGTAMTSTPAVEGFFAGVMDEARVWNRALTAAEIVAARDQTFTLPDSSLIGRWRLNENGGTSAADATTPAQNGTLTGGPAWTTTDKAPLFGTCQRPAIPGCCTANAQCNDGNPCNGVETCSAGNTCQAGTPVVCSAQDACHVAGTCSPATGLCSNPNAPNGTTCSDGNACTGNDSCTGGVCGGVTLVVPSEVTNVRFTTKTAITWNSASGAGPGTVHDAVRGLEEQLPVGSGASQSCLTPGGIAAATTADATSPPSGKAFWYLVRGKNSCGTGTYGSAAVHGVPTTQRVTTTCP